MKVEQISIFIENEKGRLAEVTRALGEAGVNIRALSLAETSDFGILRLIVDQGNLAHQALKDKGITAHKTEVVAVAVPDRPLGLYEILEPLESKNINVEYMYAFMERCSENAIMIFRFGKTDEAIRILLEKGFSVLKGEYLYNIK